MFLKELTISGNGSVIRAIKFKNGINFIVDNTPIDGGNESGNNVGKTTVLRLIDYCLGSAGGQIYHDREFRDQSDYSVSEFLHQNNVEVELIMVDNLVQPKKTLQVKRNFLAKADKLVEFNETKVTLKALISSLNQELFSNPENKPTFRSLLAKFIRDDVHKMSHTLRYLHQATRLLQYEAIHLFLLGIQLPTGIFQERENLNTLINTEERVHQRLIQGISENGLKQALIIIQRDIDRLEVEKAKLNIDQVSNDLLNKYNSLKSTSSELITAIGDKRLRIGAINDAVEELSEGVNNFDVQEIKEIYANAQFFIPQLQTKFEEVVAFHNSMINQKIAFISKNLEPLTTDLKDLEQQLAQVRYEERLIAEKINLHISFEEYNKLIEELNSLYETKGSRQERLNQIVSIKSSIAANKRRMEEINKMIEDAEVALSQSEEVLNKYFSQYSKELYNEEFFLFHEKNDDNVIEFKIRSVQPNPGGGKKKGQIAAFDLAYISFCNEVNLAAPRFVLHDSPEDVSLNQLLKIANIANGIEGQLVVAVLKEKFSELPETRKLIDDNAVVQLSQNEKLFKF